MNERSRFAHARGSRLGIDLVVNILGHPRHDLDSVRGWRLVGGVVVRCFLIPMALDFGLQ